MPIMKKSNAKDSGYAVIREHLQAFEGDVVSMELGQWGGALIDDDGKQLPPREFFEIKNINVKVVTLSGEIPFIPDSWDFRVNCSDYKGSFWVDDFLESADKAKLLLPDELIGKRVLWQKVTKDYDIKGKKFSSGNFVIGKIVGEVSGMISDTQPPSPVQPPLTEDPMALALEIAIGKTEAQFREAVSAHPSFVGSPLLPLAKAGAITQSLIGQGKLTLDATGVYRA